MSEEAAIKRARYYQRKALGQCVRCGKPADGASLCDKHWQSSTAANQARRASAAPAVAVPAGPVTIIPVLSSWTVTPSDKKWRGGTVVRL